MSLVLCSWSLVHPELSRSFRMDLGLWTKDGPRTKAQGPRTFLSVDFLLDAVLLELLVQIAARRVDDLGGFRDVPGVLAQLLHEIRALGGVFERTQRRGAGRLRLAAAALRRGHGFD